MAKRLTQIQMTTLRKLRNTYPNVGQRTLATWIAEETFRLTYADRELDDFWDLRRRPYATIYNAIRRIDEQAATQQAFQKSGVSTTDRRRRGLA